MVKQRSSNQSLRFALLSLAILLLSHQTTLAVAATSKLAKPPCRIDIDNAPISKTIFQHHGVQVVIVKGRSVCDVLQQQVLLSVTLYKTQILGDHLIATSETQQLAPSSSGLIVFNNGKWFYAGRTRSPKTLPLRCGT